MEDEGHVPPTPKSRRQLDKIKGTLRGPLRFRASVPKKHREGHRAEYPPIALNDHAFNKTKDFPENTFYTTKYTVWTFVPKVLWEQFRKATSFYFLIICIITSIPKLSPISPLTSVTGLLFILIVSAIREAYEDYARLTADTQVNMMPYSKIEEKTGLIKSILSYQISVGDLVYLRAGDRAPSDIVVLSTSSDGICYMETAPLDGETNLKQVRAVSVTQDKSRIELANMVGSLECETPHHRLYSFRGNLTIQGESEVTSLDEKNLLLMGSVLKNTEWVIGICVYAGPETKMGLNLKTPPSKFSRLDRGLNTYVIFVFAVNFSICFLLAGLATWWRTTNAAKNQELIDPNMPTALAGVAAFFSYFALLNYMIPLSLVVTLEVARFLQAKFMNWDRNMYHEGRHCIAKTSNLNDELALVEYIFSDKTGTLTENLMTFRQCSVNGVIYTDSEIGSSAKNTQGGGLISAVRAASDQNHQKALESFLTALAVCHSVQAEIDEESDEIEYKAASPDEEALCNGAKGNGYVYHSRVQGKMKVKISKEDTLFDILLEVEFTSERRRMSIVLQDSSGNITMYCKGADSVILDRLAKDNAHNAKFIPTTLAHLDSFSQIGLRTLLFGQKKLTKEEWEAFREKHHAASTLIEGRDEALDVLYDEFETELELIGASAIEDRLQDGVPETIANLRKAGIKIWVITGDKQETAINIGYSSKLLTPAMEVICINSSDEVELEQILMDNINKHIQLDEDDIHIINEWKEQRDAFFSELALLKADPGSLSNIPPVNASRAKNGTKKPRRKKKKKSYTFGMGDESDNDKGIVPFHDDEIFSETPPASTKLTKSGSFNEGNSHQLSTHNGHPSEFTEQPSYDPQRDKIDDIPASSISSSAQNSFRQFPPNAGQKRIAVVVDGKTLVHILQHFRDLFMIIARNAQSVVCNRVTPLQKAELVRLVSQSEGIVSLAIGDGGNDVSMIQQAHIGVGIQGREGNQAARASDFALPQFRHLQRLLTVHGRYCLLRNTKIIYYSIYKNSATFIPQVFFSFFNGFSASSLYNQWVMMIFNVFLTSVPIFFLGLFEKDLHESIIEQNPQVYQVHKTLKFSSLMRWFVYAIYHAVVIFWFTYAIWSPTTTVSNTGRTLGLPDMGIYMMTMAVLVVTLRLAMESAHWVFFTHFAVWGSLIFYCIARLSLSHMLTFDASQYNVLEIAFGQPTFWVSVILVVITCLFPIFAIKYLKRSYFPKEWYVLQEHTSSGLSHGKAILGFASDTEEEIEHDYGEDKNHGVRMEPSDDEYDEETSLLHPKKKLK